MQRIAAILFILATGLAIFACWGLLTRSGLHMFDEMAGIIPFAAGVAGAFLFIVAAFIWLRIRLRQR